MILKMILKQDNFLTNFCVITLRIQQVAIHPNQKASEQQSPTSASHSDLEKLF